MMKKDSKGSAGYLSYLKNIKKEARHILWIQLLSCLIFLILWEVAATIGWIDDFFVSKPSAIWFLLIKYIDASEANEEGMRSLTFEINGVMREVKIQDKNLEVNTNRILKADKNNPCHLGSTIPGTEIGRAHV